MFYFDAIFVNWIRDAGTTKSRFFLLYDSARPAVKFITHGTPLITAAVLLYIYGRFFARRLADIGMTLIAGFLSAGLGVQVVKHLLGRARPRLGDKTSFIGPSFDIDYDSFPSGHTSVAFCVAFILSGYFPKYRAVFYGFGILTAFDRLKGLSHFPSDLIGGALFGLLVGRIVMDKMALRNRHSKFIH